MGNRGSGQLRKQVTNRRPNRGQVSKVAGILATFSSSREEILKTENTLGQLILVPFRSALLPLPSTRLSFAMFSYYFIHTFLAAFLGSSLGSRALSWVVWKLDSKWKWSALEKGSKAAQLASLLHEIMKRLIKACSGAEKRSKGVFLQYIKTQDFTSASKLIKRLAYLKSFAPARRWHRHRHRHHHFHSHHHYGHWLVPDPAAPSSASRLQFNHVSAGKLLAKIRARQILRIRLVSALKGCCWSYSCCGRCCCCCQVLC